MLKMPNINQLALSGVIEGQPVRLSIFRDREGKRRKDGQPKRDEPQELGQLSRPRRLERLGGVKAWCVGGGRGVPRRTDAALAMFKSVAGAGRIKTTMRPRSRLSKCIPDNLLYR